MQRHLLIVAYHFPPAGGVPVRRTLRFIRHLPRYGWRCSVLTADLPFDPFHPMDPEEVGNLPSLEHVMRAPARSRPERLLARAWRWRAAATRRPRAGRVEAGPSGHRLRRLLHESIFFPDPKRFWVPGAVKLGERISSLDPVDAILATAYPWSAFVVAERLARTTRAPFVLDFRDAWTENPRELWDGPRNRSLEAEIAAKATGIIATTEGVAEPLRARYGDHKPVVTIPNAYDVEERPEADPSLRDPERLVVTYTGTFNDAFPPSRFDQSPYHLVQAVLRLTPEVRRRLRVRLVGKLGRSYERWIAACGLSDSIETVGWVSYRRALQYQLATDVLLCAVSEAQGAAGVVTGKLFEYVGSRRPILALAPQGELSDFVQKRQLGWVEPPEAVDRIAARLTQLVELHRLDRIPRELAPQHDCAAEIRSKVLADVLDAAVAPTRTGCEGARHKT